MADILIEQLIVESDRAAHIARHDITLDEIYEVVNGDYVVVRAKLDRWRIIGSTKSGRKITVIVGERSQPGIFGLVTARGQHEDERRHYRQKFPEGQGEKQ